MATRKELNAEARARVAEDQAAAKLRRAELAAMQPQERKEARAADRAAAKAAKAEHKSDLKQMDRAERREAKRRDRAYKRAKTRVRRRIGWLVAAAIVAIIAILVAPIVRDIGRLVSIKPNGDTAAGAAARDASVKVSEDISDEGIVLLKNTDNVLPLTESAVNVFSFESFNLRYGGAGSGGANQSASLTLYQALEERGIAYNRDLYAAMEEAGAETKSGSSNGLVSILESLMSGETDEPDSSYLTDDLLAQAREFSDTAMIVIGSGASEAADQSVMSLSISAGQRELLDTVTAAFDDVIVVINSGNQMALGFLDEYPQIKGALSIGTPGPRGSVSLAKILDGEVNPSGHLTATYAYDLESAPSTENLGNFSYENTERAVLEYEEGIYIGYRYYETRYLNDEAGYQAAVQYPFGYGQSYTSFEWSASAPVIGDDISVDVTVRNTGTVAGKDVVQVYFAAPYEAGGIEKSAIELAGYAKTGLLEPGASETVKVIFAARDMASWDKSGTGAYVLEAGQYNVIVGTDVHTPVASFPAQIAQTITYTEDETTGAALENRFGYAEGDLDFLSRSDWEGTYPDSSDINLTASAELLERMNPTFEPVEGEALTYGAENGLTFDDLTGLDYDAPEWDSFIDQLTADEQIALFSHGAYITEKIDRLGVPAATLLDGPAGLNFLFGSLTAASYPAELVVASTWNDDLARALGESIGTEANAYGIQGWYAPGMNLHRTPMGGRNFEYFSEDPLVSGSMSAAMVSGAQSKGVLTFMKHFALNEQEVNARTGVNVFVDEQALRELYLRPFEITVKEADATGAMSSFINIGGRWAGGNEELLQDVLRGEWGFNGVVSTDAVLAGFMDPALAVRNGNDLMLAMLPTSTAQATKEALEADPVGVGMGLRDRVHAVLFAVRSTDAGE